MRASRTVAPLRPRLGGGGFDRRKILTGSSDLVDQHREFVRAIESNLVLFKHSTHSNGRIKVTRSELPDHEELKVAKSRILVLVK